LLEHPDTTHPIETTKTGNSLFMGQFE
jgi:hypothetical protein